MANPAPEGDGMGSTPSGPSFAPGPSPAGWAGPGRSDAGWSDAGWSDTGWSDTGWSDTGWSGSGGPTGGPPLGPVPPQAPDPRSYRPPPSRRPAVLTAAALAVVALVVAVASLLAYRADRDVAAEPTRSIESPRVTAVKDSIEFSSRSGAGRLTIVDHSWRETSSDPGATLQLQIRIECTSGTVGYDPYDFHAFDATGNLFDLADEDVTGPLLGVGVLQPGEQTTGRVAFVIPRGEVTLLMSDQADSVTALRVPD